MPHFYSWHSHDFSSLFLLGGLQAHLVFYFDKISMLDTYPLMHFIFFILLLLFSFYLLFVYLFIYYGFKLGVSAAHINLKSYLAAPKAHLIADIYIFRTTGNVTFGNETTEVQNGTMKFFVEVNFCLFYLCQ